MMKLLLFCQVSTGYFLYLHMMYSMYIFLHNVLFICTPAQCVNDYTNVLLHFVIHMYSYTVCYSYVLLHVQCVNDYVFLHSGLVLRSV